MTLSARLASLHGAYISVGLAGQHPSGMSAGELGRILAKGTRDEHIPARDFLTGAAESARLIGQRSLRLAAQAGMRGRDPRPALRRGAEAAHEALIREIEDFDTPANAPATIRAKGKDDPLVDSGSLLDLTYAEYAVGDLAR